MHTIRMGQADRTGCVRAGRSFALRFMSGLINYSLLLHRMRGGGASRKASIMAETISDRGRALEEAFFLKRDAELLARKRELARMEHTQKALSQVSGITNSAVLKRLAELDVEPQVLASLAIIPLVEVAWADGAVQDAERRAILEAARELKTGCGSVNLALLESWLGHKPPRKLLDAWVHYVEGLADSLTASQREQMRRDLVDRARRVAAAAGGFLGLGAVSAEEQAVLEQMDRPFSEPHAGKSAS